MSASAPTHSISTMKSNKRSLPSANYLNTTCMHCVVAATDLRQMHGRLAGWVDTWVMERSLQIDQVSKDSRHMQVHMVNSRLCRRHQLTQSAFLTSRPRQPFNCHAGCISIESHSAPCTWSFTALHFHAPCVAGNAAALKAPCM